MLGTEESASRKTDPALLKRTARYERNSPDDKTGSFGPRQFSFPVLEPLGTQKGITLPSLVGGLGKDLNSEIRSEI